MNPSSKWFRLWHSIISAIFVNIIFSTQVSQCLPFSKYNYDDSVEVETFPPTSDYTMISTNSLPEKAFFPKVNSVFIKSKIRFRYARTRIISEIVNPDTKRSHNISYTLRIPKEAFISRFEMRIDDELHIYKANVTRREDARKLYELAIGEGKSVTLGLIEQTGPDFDEVVLKFVIGSRRKILFSVIYEERLPRILDRYETVIYLVPDQISNKTYFRVEVHINENLSLKSVSVPLDDAYSNRNASINRVSNMSATITWSNFHNGQVKWSYPESEFIVSYELENELSTGHVMLRNGYFVHFFAPTNLQPLVKHVIFILDISDSMHGDKMNQTVSAMVNILDELKPEDYFNIITFSSDVTIWSCFHGTQNSKLLPFEANAQCKDEARFFIRRCQPHGSTNMHDALVTGLKIAEKMSPLHTPSLPKSHRWSKYKESPKEQLPPNVQSMIIFFTDGEATSGVIDKRAILTKVKILNHHLSVPIFSLAFGESVDFVFLSKLSSRNRGFARKIYENADPSFQLAEFYRQISSPVLANLSFRYEAQVGSAGGYNQLQSVNSGYSMIFRGTDILTIGRLGPPNAMNNNNGTIVMNATVSGIGRNGSVIYTVPITDCNRQGSCPDVGDNDDKCVEKLFVYLTMKKLLLENQIFGKKVNLYDDEQGNVIEIKERVIQLALQYGLVTPFTSMVMRTKSIREEEMDVAINSQEDEEVEIFLGSEMPLPDSSKLIREFNIETMEVKPKNTEGLPVPIALIKSFDELDKTSNASVQDIYKIFEELNNVTAEVKNISSASESSRGYSKVLIWGVHKPHNNTRS